MGQSEIEPKTVDELLKELNANFTLNGLTINPLIFFQLSGGENSITDGLGIFLSLDILQGQSSNTFYCDSCEGKTEVMFPNEEGIMRSYFSYKYEGKTQNNIHVVSTSESGEGSGVWGSILFVEFKKYNIMKDGRLFETICISLVGEAIGTSFFGQYGRKHDIEIDKNRVSVTYILNDLDEKGIENITAEIIKYDF